MRELYKVITSQIFIEKFLKNLFWGFLILVLVINCAFAGSSLFKRGPNSASAQEELVEEEGIEPLIEEQQASESQSEGDNQFMLMDNPEDNQEFRAASNPNTQSSTPSVTVVRRYPECAGGPGMVRDVEQLSDGSFRTFNEHFQTGACGDTGTVQAGDQVVRRYSECAGTGPGRVHDVEQLSNGGFRTSNEHFQPGVCGDSAQQPTSAPTPIIQRSVTTIREVERDRDTDSSSRSSATANARGGTTNISLAQNPTQHFTPTPTPTPTPTLTPTPVPTHKTFPVSRQTFISSPTTAPTFTQLQTSPPVTIIQSERLPVENQAQTVDVSQTQSQNQTQTQNNTQNVTNTNTATGGSSGSTEPTRVIITSASTPTTTTYQQPAQVPAVEQKSVPVVTQSAPAADTKELPKTGLPLAGVGLASLIPVGLKLRRSGAPTTLPELSANSIWIERQLKV